MYTLRDIPATMRKEGWSVGASLMDRWFATGPYAMDLRVKTGDLPAPAPYVDTSLVTMDWVLRCKRAAAANARLTATWATPQRLEASRPQIEKQVKRWVAANAVDTTKPFRFGDLRRPVPFVNATSAINIEVVESEWYGPVDDFYAALGKALLKIAVSGMVEPAGDAWRLTIDETGIFLRDTYDFIGDQRLGSWGPRGFSRLAVGAPEIEVDYRRTETLWEKAHDLFTVGNVDFRRYRALFSKGGDFVVFSNLRFTKLDQPVIVMVAGS